MMKENLLKRLSALATIFVLAIGAYAQEVEIQNGAQFVVEKNEYVESVLDVNSDGTSFLTKAGWLGNKFRVLNLNAQLNEKSKFDIEIPEQNGKKLKYFWSLKLGNSVYFMSRYFDKKANDYYLYASELDPKSGKFVRHLEAVKTNNKSFRSWTNPFSAVRSIDSSQVLFITEYPTSGSENASYGLKCVDDKMNSIWSKDITFPHMDKDFTVLDYDIDRKGNIHFTTGIRMSWDEKEDKDSKGRYYLIIYSYFHETDELVTYEIGFVNELIRAIDLDVNVNDELIGTGFYSEKQFADSYKGFFYIRIDPKTKDVKAKTLTPFSKELLIELIGERKAEKGRELPAYEIRESIALPNGGMAVVAEHYVYTYSQTTNPQTGEVSTYETWLYGNVVVMYIDADGKMESAGVLKKKQLCTAKNGAPTIWQSFGIGIYPGVNELPYYGIATMLVNGNIHILYNENPKNAERLASDKKPLSVRQKNSETMFVTFSPEGQVTTSILFKSKDKEAGYNMPLMPRSSIQYAKNSMIVFGRKGKKMRVSRVTVK